MLRELLVSVVSGVIVAMVLSLFRSRDGRETQPPARRPVPPSPQQWQQPYVQSQKRRGSFFGGLMRFIFSVAGGIGLAYIAANALHLRHFHGMSRAGGIATHSPMLLFTVIGTVIVWLLLSSLTRR